MLMKKSRVANYFLQFLAFFFSKPKSHNGDFKEPFVSLASYRRLCSRGTRILVPNHQIVISSVSAGHREARREPGVAGHASSEHVEVFLLLQDP